MDLLTCGPMFKMNDIVLLPTVRSCTILCCFSISNCKILNFTMQIMLACREVLIVVNVLIHRKYFLLGGTLRNLLLHRILSKFEGKISFFKWKSKL